MTEPYSQPPSNVPSVLNINVITEETNIRTNKNLAARPQVNREISFARSLLEIFNTPKEEKDEGRDPTKLPIRERLRHFTWTWFTMTMATGGVANVLYVTFLQKLTIILNQSLGILYQNQCDFQVYMLWVAYSFYST